MKRRIFLFPEGGLGNRIRTINSAIEFANLISYNMTVFWVKDNGCNCSYETIFSQKNRIHVVEINFYIYKFVKALFVSFKLFFNDKNCIFMNCRSMSMSYKYRKYIFILTCHRLLEKYGQTITFSDQIIYNASIYLENFSEETIGIHVRRTDNVKSIEFSSINSFEREIQNALIDNANASFYLSSDDVSIKQYFKNLYADKIITVDSTLSRKSSRGIIDAAVEIYLLSKTKYIIGSFYSSFSEVASEMGSKQLIVASN